MSTVIKAGNVTNGMSFSPDGTGAFEFKTGTGAGTTALTLSSTQIATFASTIQTAGITTNLYPIVSGTAVASTSGTSIDFTGIPAWVKRITVMFNGVSTSGTSGCLLQLGYQSPVTSTGYVSGTSAVANNVVGSLTTSTAGVLAASGLIAAQTLNGSVIFSTLGSNIWVAQGSTYSSATATFVVAGSVTLSGTLDRVRITTVNGTDTFDAGSINILYE